MNKSNQQTYKNKYTRMKKSNLHGDIYQNSEYLKNLLEKSEKNIY